MIDVGTVSAIPQEESERFAQLVRENAEMRAAIEQKDAEILRDKEVFQIEILREKEALRAEIARLEAEMAAQRAQFLHEMALLARQIFGRRSERLVEENRAQLSLLSIEEEQTLAAAQGKPESGPKPEASPVAPVRPHTGGGRRTFPKHLKRISVQSTEKGPTDCPKCAQPMDIIGAETSERLEYIPGHFQVVVCERAKRACACCPEQGVFLQPAPPFGLDRSQYADGFVARVLVDKFADNLPLRRQERRFEREGIDVPIANLCRIVQASAGLLKHVVDAMADELRAGSFLQGDGTGLRILADAESPQSNGALWVYTDGDQAVFEATRTHEGLHPAGFLDGFQGVFLPDGAANYNAACAPPNIERAGCWAHVRRKFFDARGENPAAFHALRQIRDLFLIEREAWTLDAEGRNRLRQMRAKPWIASFREWLKKELETEAPSGGYFAALRYADNQWPRLLVFLDHPEVPIHNNTSERALRGPVTGRKNWLFAGSEGGAEAAAVHFSIVASCMLAGIDPFAYLRDVLHRLPDAKPSVVKQLTPRAWAQRERVEA